MTRYHNIDGERVPFSEEEEIRRDIKEKKDAESKSMNQWIEHMERSDSAVMPRWMEDHIEHDHRGKSKSDSLKESYRKKKLLRNSKPL